MSTRNDDPFAHAMTDLMSGVAVTFLLIASIFMMLAIGASMKARDAKAATDEKLNRIHAQDGDARRYLEDLFNEFTADANLSSALKPDYNAAEDPYTLTLTLNRERFAFESEKCELAPAKLEEAREPLRKAVAKVCRAVTAAKASAREQSPGTGPSISISLEGHTDTKPFFPREASCGASVAPCSRGEDASCAAIGFENNVRLSGSRAQFLFFKLRGFVHDDAALASCLDEGFTVAGRGPVEPIGSDSQNRRVVFKVRVRAGATAVMGHQ